MPTAIVSVYTREGFLIAADGLDYCWDRQRRIRENVQKIWEVNQRERCLAYSLTGTDRIAPSDALDEIVYEFVPELMTATDELAKDDLPDLERYLQALQGKLWPLPVSARQALATYDIAPQEFIIFAEGYYRGEPERGHIKFSVDGKPPVVKSDGLYPGEVLGVSPKKIRQLVESIDNDKPLRAHRASLHEIQTMDEAMNSAEVLMAALYDPEASQIDERCKAIGGHRHMCKITPSAGFQWVIPPQAQ